MGGNQQNKPARPCDYEVGYGKPPRSTRFKKGQSGNPRGRPRRDTSLDASIERRLDRLVPIERDGRRETVTLRELGIIKLIRKALQDDQRALRFVFAMIRKIEPPPKRPAFVTKIEPGTATWEEGASDKDES